MRSPGPRDEQDRFQDYEHRLHDTHSSSPTANSIACANHAWSCSVGSGACRSYQSSGRRLAGDAMAAEDAKRPGHHPGPPTRETGTRTPHAGSSALLNSTLMTDHCSAVQRVSSITRRPRLMRSQGCQRRTSASVISFSPRAGPRCPQVSSLLAAGNYRVGTICLDWRQFIMSTR